MNPMSLLLPAAAAMWSHTLYFCVLTPCCNRQSPSARC